MFGIEKDFQNLMEQVYGPLGEKQMTKQEPPTIIEIGGVKYKRVEEEPEELKTLYQMVYDNKWTARSCDEVCNIVKEWMSQYNCDTNKWDEDYKCGFLDCIDVLRKNLK